VIVLSFTTTVCFPSVAVTSGVNWSVRNPVGVVVAALKASRRLRRAPYRDQEGLLGFGRRGCDSLLHLVDAPVGPVRTHIDLPTEHIHSTRRPYSDDGLSCDRFCSSVTGNSSRDGGAALLGIVQGLHSDSSQDCPSAIGHATRRRSGDRCFQGGRNAALLSSSC
jgi:hypothetical protein